MTTTYDDIPYPSYCYPMTAPENISAIAQLFGMPSIDLNTARILEIGCASGGNLIPLAARFPDADFVGIDLSSVQIAEAKKCAETLDLRNVTFEAKSILDLELFDQKYDFIIAHGVYSWVTYNIQDKILEICEANLHDDGVVYISYNTLPGWNAVKTIRDMMLFHGKNFSDPAERVVEARRMLNFVADNIHNDTGPYKKTLVQEMEMLGKLTDNYLLHDHLEAVNDPCYFHEFMEHAEKHNLVYLGDCDLPTMYIANQKDDAAKKLEAITDVVRQEQYFDYLNNRRFRSTLLVKRNAPINRSLTSNSVRHLKFLAKYAFKKPIQASEVISLETLELVHVANPNVTAVLTGKYACACYIQLVNMSPVAQSSEQLIEAVHKMDTNENIKHIKVEWDNLVLDLIFRGIIYITTTQAKIITTISDCPRVFSVARMQGLNNNMVPNLRHEKIRLENDHRIVLQYVNGDNTIDQIRNAVRIHIDTGELVLNINGQSVDKDRSDIDKIITEYVNSVLVFFAQNSLLDA